MKTLLKFIVVLALAVPFHAQDSSKNSQETARKDNTARDIMPDDAYKMTFVVYEVEEGKRTNQRDYVMIARTMGGNSTLKVGTRVPVTVKEKETQYIDVGMEVRCLLREPSPGKLRAQLDITVTSFALPEQTSNTTGGALPVLRNASMSVAPTLMPGKAVLVASVDDVNSKKRFQVEVTAVKAE